MNTNENINVMENNFFEQLASGTGELSLDELELVAGGKRRPFVKAMAKNVNVRQGPGTEYPVVAQLGYLDEVAVVSHRIVRDSKGHYWAKVTVGVSQNKFVDGWVCSKHCKGCWN